MMRAAQIGRVLTTIMVIITAAILGLASGVSCSAATPQFRLIDPELVDDPKFGSCARTGTTLQAAQTQFALLTSICMQHVGDAGVRLDPPEEPVVKDAGIVQLKTDAQVEQ